MSDKKTQSIPKQKENSVASEEKKLITVPEYIGLRINDPENYIYNKESRTENLIKNSSLEILIAPSVPQLSSGGTIFTLDKSQGWSEYVKELKNAGFQPNPIHTSQNRIKIIAQADNFPTDTFTNDYGDTFLNKITDIVGTPFLEVAQMTGSKNATEVIKTGTDAIREMGIPGVSDLIGGGGDKLDQAKQWAEKNKNDKGVKGGFAKVGDLTNRLLAGQRLDFPMIWKNSGYSSTYSFNVRLYNPRPADEQSTISNIVAPLAALLALALPRAKDRYAYSYPLFCSVECKGLFIIQSGAIQSISVAKGGDAGLIAHNQRVGMVDVRIEFINLFNNMVSMEETVTDVKPTLLGYLDNLRDSVSIDKIYDEGDYSEKDSIMKELKNPIQSAIGTLQDTAAKAAKRVSDTAKNTLDRLVGIPDLDINYPN